MIHEDFFVLMQGFQVRKKMTQCFKSIIFCDFKDTGSLDEVSLYVKCNFTCPVLYVDDQK